MTDSRLSADPMRAPCPRCSALPDQLCVRLSGPYGLGDALRRPHRQRFRAAREQADRELERLTRPARQ